MLWRRILPGTTSICKYHLSSNILHSNYVNNRGFTSLLSTVKKNQDSSTAIANYCSIFGSLNQGLINRKCHSKNLPDDEVTQLEKAQFEKDLHKIKELFPEPRVTLNTLTNKTPEKIFDIHYKQNILSPKGVKKKSKKSIQANDWTCTYTFIWPEKIRFEGTAISKRQAAEKAATQALHYLYVKKRISDNGLPIYDRDKIEELKTSIQEPIKITISEKSMQRVEKIWNEYQDGIKDIFDSTIKAAQNRILTPAPVLKKDSTIDDDDQNMEVVLNAEEMVDVSESKDSVHPIYGRPITPPSVSTLERRDRLLRQKFERYDEEIMQLPIDEYRTQIVSTLKDSRVAVLVGAAGCGKSTRAPAAILRELGSKCSAIVSEPRRVAAIGLAERVAGELGEQVGDSIGFQVRLHSKPPRPPAGSILYCTSGVLLKRLQANPGLIGCTHVFIDEAHERDVNTDITLLMLKRALDRNPDLKIVVMSATLDTDVFTRYFQPCPVIEVPGRTFPVVISYLDDIQKAFNINLLSTQENCMKEDSKPHVNCQELVEVIKAVDRSKPEGAILVFLPGWAEIRQTKLLLDSLYSDTTHMILPVHSRLSTTDQKKMFSKPLPGIRKIVLATNIAETSITIPDVIYVIDSGAHKENRIKQDTGTASLETVWVSIAGGKQRAGRAGRVQPGHCYRLYTREKENEFAAHTTPEILRIPLEQTVLDCKTYAPDDKVENFLSQLPEPPTQKAIKFAVNDLIDLGALTPNENMTRLGSLISNLTLHPRLGCALLYAGLAGNALALANVLTHCGDNVQLFVNATDRRDEIRNILREHSPTSDHAAFHWLQEEFERELEEKGWLGVDPWCDKYGLRKDRLKFVKSLSTLHLEQLLKCGLIESTIEPEELNRFSGIDVLTSALLLSGANSILKTRKSVKTKGKLKTVLELYTTKGDRAHIGSESVNYNITKSKNTNNFACYFGGYHSTDRRALVVYKTSLIPPHTALLFSKGNVKKEVLSNADGSEYNTVLNMPKHKLHVNMDSTQADHILKTREMLWNTLQYYIERDLKSLDFEENTRISRFKVRLMKTIGRILEEGHREYVERKSVDKEFFDR